MEILIKKLNNDAILPKYGRVAGPTIELYTQDETEIAPQSKVLITTGIALALPVGYVGLILNQQSTVVHRSVRVTAMMVDSGYRDEIKIEITNTAGESVIFAKGEKVAEMVIQEVTKSHLIEVEDLGGEE